MPVNFNLDNLQKELEKDRPKKKKLKIKGAGFARQKKVMEEANYYSKSKRKKSVNIVYNKKK